MKRRSWKSWVTVFVLGLRLVSLSIAAEDRRPDGASSSNQPSHQGTEGPAEGTDANQGTSRGGGRAYPSRTVGTAAETAARARIELALASRGDFNYPGVPLSDVSLAIAEQFHIPVVIADRELEDYGIARDHLIECNLKDVSLRSALRIMLDPLELGVAIRDEVLFITTKESIENRLTTRLFDLAPLLPQRSERVVYQSSDRATPIKNLIMSTIEPDSWAPVGGPGFAEFVDHLNILVVSQTDEVLDDIEALLAVLLDMKQTSQSPAASDANSNASREQPAADVSSDDDGMYVYIYEVFAFQPLPPPETIPASPLDDPFDGEETTPTQFALGYNQAAFDNLPTLHEAIAQAKREKRAKAVDLKELVRFIPRAIAPDTWGEGQGVIEAFHERIIVRQTRDVHRQVHQLLVDLDILKPRPGQEETLVRPFSYRWESPGSSPVGPGGFFDIEPEASRR